MRRSVDGCIGVLDGSIDLMLAHLRSDITARLRVAMALRPDDLATVVQELRLIERSLRAAVLLPGESSMVQVGKVFIGSGLYALFEQKKEEKLLYTFPARELQILDTLFSFPAAQTTGVPSGVLIDAVIQAVRRQDGSTISPSSVYVSIHRLRGRLKGTSFEIPSDTQRTFYRLAVRGAEK